MIPTSGILAQSAAPPAPLTPEERQTEFVPVQGGNDTTSAEALLVTAYLVMWVALLAFVLLTWRRLARLEAKLTQLTARMKGARPGG